MKRSPSVFLRLLRLAFPLAGWMALAVLLGVATIGSSIGLMTTSAFIIASAALQPPLADIQVAIVGVRFFGISRGVFRYLERYVSHHVTFRLLARLRVWFYRSIEPLAPVRLQQMRSGDLLSRVVGDIETLENFYIRVIAPPVVALIVSLGSAAFMLRYDPSFALVLLIGLTLAGVAVPVITRWLSRAPGRALIAGRADLNVLLVDGVQGAADLIAYGQSDRQAEQVGQLSEELANLRVQMARIEGFGDMVGNLLLYLTTLAVLIAGVPLVRSGDLTGIQLTVLVMATIASFEAVLPLPVAFQHLETNLEAGRRLFDLVDAEPEIASPESPSDIPAVPALAINDLHFAYSPTDPPALNGVTFSLRSGQRIAIVGPSGAGKSTLAALLLRFWDVNPGQIVLNGTDIRDYDPDDVRHLFALVDQSTYLFNATIRENLLLARPDAPDVALIDAAKQARIHEFIQSLPDGYETWVGEQGVRLSGGERQRIALARALLKQAPILLLDEPTANLDALTEQAVLHTLVEASAGRSMLLITHRLVGLESFNEILVLQAGRIVERGTHAELITVPGGVYRRMVELQNEVLVVE